MKRKILLRGMLGFPIGVAIGYFITIIISLIWAGGYYSPCVPDLISIMGNEIYAVLLQALLCGFLGVGFAASSVIWEIEHWSLVKQTGIYFIIISVIMVPVAWINYWMEHSVPGVFRYFAIFALIFVIIWMVQFVIGKNNVKRMNENLPWKDENNR
ncbi:MAG: DUF3021 domain-containing protein [Eubacterium sp.]|nr:DUF3021 domain-containing protein [Eubacterium sp.]